MEEESYSSHTISLGVVKRFIFFRVPFLALIAYSLALINYPSIGYLCFGLILLNLEIEKRFKKNKDLKKLEGNKHAKVRDMLDFKNYKQIVYYLLLIYSLIVFLGKLVILLSYYFWPHLSQRASSYIEHNNFELYFIDDFNIENFLITFLPNLAIILMAGVIILSQGYLSKARIDTLGKFRAIGVSYYILVGLIVVTTFCLSIANVSFGSMLFITVIVVFLLLWSNLKIRHTRRFYPFARVLQVFSIIAIILQYLASINTFRAVLAKIQVMNLTFLGMTNYNEFTSTFPMICSVLCLFGVLLFSTYFADVKKLEEVREIVQKITTPNLLEDFNKAFSIEIDLEKEGENHEEHKEQEEEHKEEYKEEEKEEEHKEEEHEEEKENHEEPLVPKKQNIFLRRAKTLVTQTWYGESAKSFQAKMIPVIKSLKKIGFLVRVLQVGTILVISRYNTVFSLPMMIWLFVTSLTYRLNIIYFVTLFLGLPSSVLQFYALYFGQIPDNMITPNIPTWCGNLTIDSHWLECLLSFALFILHCNFLRLLKINLNKGKNRMSTSPETPSASSGALTNGWVNLLVTLFLKNTYYLSLIGLYVIGTYEVSIFNLVLVVFFIVFFVSEKYAKRYWSSLLIIVIIILSTRYIWVMGWFSVDSNEPGLSIPLSLVGIVDIDIETTNLTGTIADQDSTTNIVFWTMFLFVLLQYDVYRNTRGYQKTTLEILRESKFLNKKFPSLRYYIETLRSIYYQGFFWFGYMVITLILCIEDFSLLGLAQAALLTFIFSLHIFRIKANPETAHHRMFRLWNLFILSSTLIIAVIYFYSFTRFNFLEDYILDLAEESDVLNFIIVNALFIGLSDATSLRTVLLGQIFILVFAVSMRDICKLYRRLYYEKIFQQQERQAEEMRNPNEAPLLNSFSNLQQHEESEKYLQASFLRQWPRLARALEIISYFFTAIAFLYVLILSTRFRLSVMFLIMLAIYCYYFYKLNSAAIGLFNKRHLPIKINLVLDELREWFINNYSMENRFINKFAEQTSLLAEFLELSLKWRLKVWKLVFLCSISSFLLTYMFRMLSFPLFQTGDAFLAQNVINSNNATFIFGVYAQNSGFLSVNYPYILLIIISVIELNLAQLLEKLIMIKLKPVEKKQEEDIQVQRRTSDNNTNNNVNMPSHRPSSVIVSAEAMKNLIPEKILIDENAQIEEIQEDEETSKVQFTFEQTEIIDEILYTKEDNILIEESESHDSPFIPNRFTFSHKDAVKNYYQENFSYLQLQVLEGCYALATQAMVWIMLFNAVNKQNIFGAYYLIGACLVWKYMDKEMKIITKITNFTIIVLLIQYALLVFNINPATSPMTLPSINNTPSILAYIYGSTMISQNQFIKVLGLGNSYSVTLSLIGDGVTFLVVQLCMWINVLRAEYILNSLPNNLMHESQVEKFEESPQHKRGYKSLRPFNYGLLKTAAKLIILHSSRITILILTFISLFNVSIPNFILAALFLANIILIDFRLSELTFEKRTKLMIIMFKVTQVCLIIFLAIYIVMNLPFNAFPLFVFNTTTIDKIFIFCILQLHLNLIRTDYYVSVYKKHNEKSSVKARLSAMCITYKFNDTKLYKYLQNYIRKKNLNVKLEEISERIENWNNQFANDARSHPPKLTYGEANTVVKDEEKGENQFDNYGPTQEIIVETEEHEEEDDNKDHEHDEHEDHDEDAKKEEDNVETKKRSLLTRIKVALVRKLIQWRNPFLFAYTSDLYKYVVENNKNITSDKMKVFSLNWTTSELQKASTTLDYIDSFYANLELTIQQNPESDIDKSIERLTQSGFEHHYVPRSRGNTNVTVIQFGEEEAMPELPVMRRLGSIWKSSMIMDDQDEVTKDDEYEDYSIFQTFSLVIQVCLSYWEYFCYFAFVLYQITSQGYLMILIPIAIFGYALTEETRCTFRFWTISFVFIATVTLIKFVFECFFYTGSLSSSSFGQFLQTLVGPTTGFYWEFSLIVMLLIQVALIKQYGFEQASEATVENVNKAFLRRKIHNDFADLKPKQKTIVKHESIKSATSASPLLKPPSNQGEIPDLEKTLSEVELDFKNNLIRFPQTSKANYFFRLFSPSNKKIGRDIYPLIALLQLIVAIFIILFYSSIEDGELSESLVDSLKFNEFSGPMVIILFLQIGIVLLDRRIILINNKKQKIMKEEKLTFSERVSSRKSIYSRLNAEEKRVERPKRNSTIIAAKPKRTKDKKKTTKVTDKVMANIANSHALTEEAFLTHAIFFKFVLQAVLLLAMTIFIYFYVPNVQEAPWPLNDPATIIFYILYIIYFTLSALQLKYGIPEFSGRMVLMNDYTFYNSIAYQSYRAIPFFFEIKTFMDWTFTVTALDLFQWLKFEDVYGQLFVAKINTDMRLEDRSLGEKIDKISKFFFGCCGIFLLLVLILGPLLLFSTYNPFGTDDYVVGATVSVGLQIQNYYFPIFENSHVATIQPVTSAQYSAMANQPGVRDVGYNSLQYITMSPFSEQTWSIAEPNFALLQTSLNDISQLLSTETVDTLNSSTNTSANLQVNVEFLQYQSQSTNSAPVTTTLTYNFYDSNVSSHVNATISMLYNMTNCSGDQLHVPGAYDSLFRLTANQAPIPAGSTNTFSQGVYLQLICPPNITGGPDNSLQIANSYWQITTDGKSTGFVFFTITNTVSSFLISFSIEAFYIGIVLLVGNVVRTVVMGQIQNLTLSDLPDARELIQVCEGILIARAEKNLVKEEILYWELIDILRSPEVLKLITKSAVQERLLKAEKIKKD